MKVSNSRNSRQSIRTQLIVGTVTGLLLVLVLFGLTVRYVVATTLMNSVDRDLQERILQVQRRSPGPPHPPDGGDGHFGPPDQQGFDRPPSPDDQGVGQGPPPNQATQDDQSQNGHSGPPMSGQPPTDGYDQGPMAGGPQGPPDQGHPGMDQIGRSQLGISSSTIAMLNQLDALYHPRRFSIDGASMDRFGRAPAWDNAAVKEAGASNEPVYSIITGSGVRLRVLTIPVKTQNGNRWVFQVPYPLTQVDQATSGVDKALLILIPIALIVAALGGALLTKRVLARVGQMVHTAGSIGADDLSQRLPVVGNDEFAELAETFNAMLARVDTAFQEQAKVVEQQRRFTADASHELKTPLTLIRGTTSLALAGIGTLDRQSTEDIDSAAESMSALVQDLIYLARSDSGQLGHERIEMLLIEPLQRAIDRIAPLSDAPIRVMAAKEDLVVEADESQMVRLFSNILQNAANHTPQNGRIIVSLSSNKTEAIVMINDSGVGIAPQHIQHLGERFYRADSSRTRGTETSGGSGLGLAICLGIVEAHHGTLKIDSILGKGTTVTVTLPRSAATE